MNWEKFPVFKWKVSHGHQFICLEKVWNLTSLSFKQQKKLCVFFSKVLDTFVKINKFDNVWLPIFVMLNTSQRITMFFRFQKSDQKESRYYRFWQKRTIHILRKQFLGYLWTGHFLTLIFSNPPTHYVSMIYVLSLIIVAKISIFWTHPPSTFADVIYGWSVFA